MRAYLLLVQVELRVDCVDHWRTDGAAATAVDGVEDALLPLEHLSLGASRHHKCAVIGLDLKAILLVLDVHIDFDLGVPERNDTTFLLFVLEIRENHLVLTYVFLVITELFCFQH